MEVVAAATDVVDVVDGSVDGAVPVTAANAFVTGANALDDVEVVGVVDGSVVEVGVAGATAVVVTGAAVVAVDGTDTVGAGVDIAGADVVEVVTAAADVVDVVDGSVVGVGTGHGSQRVRHWSQRARRR